MYTITNRLHTVTPKWCVLFLSRDLLMLLVKIVDFHEIIIMFVQYVTFLFMNVMNEVKPRDLLLYY